MRRPPRARRTGPRRRVIAAGSVVRALVHVVPPAAVLIWGGSVFISHVNYYLRNAAPLVSQILSGPTALNRPVHIGRITPSLTFARLFAFLRYPRSFAALPIDAYDVTIATQRTTYVDAQGKTRVFDEPALTGSRYLVKAPRVTLYVSLPTLIAENFAEVITQIQVDSPEGWVARSSDGRLSIAQIVPPKKKPAKPSPPFRTLVRITNGDLHLIDYASLRAKASPGGAMPDKNEVVGVSGVADLTGARDYRFDVSARSAPNTLTARRLTGGLRVWGTWGRTDVHGAAAIPRPGEESARYLIQATVSGADVPYWYYYFLPNTATTATAARPEVFHLVRGAADVTASLAGPRPVRPGAPVPGLSLVVNAAFRDAALTTGFVPISVSGASGSVVYNDGTVLLDARGAALNAKGYTVAPVVTANGALWNLTAAKPGATPQPSMAMTVAAPHVAVTPVARLLFDDRGNPLPPGLTVGGDGAINALISGTTPDVVATGTVSGLAAAYRGYPAARNVSGAFTFSGGVLSVTRGRADIEGGGVAVGRATVRIQGGDAATRGGLQFQAAGRDIDLDRIAQLRPYTSPSGDARFRLFGRGDFDVVGRRYGGNLGAVANVSAVGLSVGRLGFPVARARVFITQRAGDAAPAFSIPSARIESAAGALAVGGTVNPSGSVAARWTATGLDLASLGTAFGIDGLSGLVTASGTLTGPSDDPRVVLSNLLGLNVRLRVPTSATSAISAAGSAPPPSPNAAASGTRYREFAADVIHGRNLVLTRRGLALRETVAVRRFPAAVFLAGSVTNILPPSGGGGWNPHLNLNARVENLEFSEVQRQLREDVAAATVRAVLKPSVAAKVGAKSAPATEAAAAASPATAADAMPISGEITDASLSAQGPVSNLQINGSANLGRLLVRAGADSGGKPIEYPLDSGSFDFSYNRNRTLISNALVQASVGELTGSATILNNGAISGTLRAPSLDTGRLAFLTRRYFSLEGKLAAAAAVGGTLTHPTIAAQVGPSDLTVAGLPIGGLTLRGLTWSADTDTGTSRIDLESLSFQEDGTSVAVGRTFYEMGAEHGGTTTNRFETDLHLQTENLGSLIDTVRNSGLRDVEAGRSLVASLDRLQSVAPIASKTVVAQVHLSGAMQQTRKADGSTETKLVDALGSADVTGKDFQVAKITAPTLDAHATLVGQTLSLERFSINSTDATFLAHGTYQFDSGAINLSLDSNGARLDALRSFSQFATFPLSGEVDLSARVTGTLDRPSVMASLQGNNLDVVRFVPGKAEPVSLNFPLQVVRLVGTYTAGEDGLGRIDISDAFVEHANSRITVAGSLPTSTKSNDPRLAGQLASLRATAEQIDLADFAPLLGTPTADKHGNPGTPAALTGKIAAQLTIGGADGAPVRLSDARLSGFLTVTDASFRAARPPGVKTDAINPISSLNARLTLSGDNVNFDSFVLKLGGPNGDKGDFGDITVTGGAHLSSLKTIQGLLTPISDETPAGEANAARAAAAVAGDELDLTAKLNNLRPVEDDLFNFGESVTAKVNGTLHISGNPQTPLIEAPRGAGPIQLSNPQVRLTSRAITPTTPTGGLPVVPSFGTSARPIPIVIDGKATLTEPGTFSFEASGSGSLGGSLAPAPGTDPPAADIRLMANLDVLGGYFQLPTVRFRVQRGGTITVAYNATEPTIVANDVTATARRYADASTNLTNYGSNIRNQIPTAAQAPVSGGGDSYDITATLNGPIRLFDTGADVNNLSNATAATSGAASGAASGGLPLKFTATERSTGRSLSQNEIVAIIGSQQQVDLASQGRVQDAVQQIGQQFVYNSLLPNYLAPVTDALQNTLGLTNLSVEPSSEGFTNIFAQARLPDPLTRFVVEFTQQIKTNTQQMTQAQPYLFSLAYDMFRIKPTAKVQPRIQSGVSTDDQHVVTYFLRGTVSY